MQQATVVAADTLNPGLAGAVEAHSGPAWGAILGGAVAAAALSLILLALGSGLGLSAISPWSYQGATATGVGIGAIVWLLFMAAAASGLGGYLAGRLRPKWVGVSDDESFFRDSAHGFLVWAVATIVSAALLTTAATAMVGTAVKAGTAVAGTAVAAGAAATPSVAEGADPTGYFADMLFRGSGPTESGTDPAAIRDESLSIMTHALQQGELSAGDKTYLGQLVARRTGLSQGEAEQRVTQVAAAAKSAADAAEMKARAAAETARKTGLYLALWVFVSLLLGAFCASLAATIGGRQRDRLAAAR
jgi:hypothetical protein